ncbi:MAG: hypothetical protein ABJE95_00445 [Byssovorax sp.]
MPHSGLREAMRAAAMRYPGAEEGIACPGTALESSAFKARKKTFLFVSAAHARLKLRQAIPEAVNLAANEPARYQVGALGWIKVTFEPAPGPPLELLYRWIAESYRVVVAGDSPAKAVVKTPVSKATAKKKTPSRG